MSEESPELLNLNSLYLSDGKNRADWEYFFADINNESNCEKIVIFLKNNMIKQPQNLLTLDILDYIFDNGCPKMLNLIAQKDFMEPFLNLLKSETNAGIENQKKVIYLTQKWAKKFSNNNNYSIFQENYNLLKNSGVCFPPDNFVIDTYNKYIGNTGNNIKNNNQLQGTNSSNQNNNNNQQNNNQQNNNMNQNENDFSLFNDGNNNENINNSNNNNNFNNRNNINQNINNNYHTN